MSGAGAAAPHNTGDRDGLLVLLTVFRAAPGSQARGALASFPEGLTSPLYPASDSFKTHLRLPQN